MSQVSSRRFPHRQVLFPTQNPTPGTRVWCGNIWSTFCRVKRNGNTTAAVAVGGRMEDATVVLVHGFNLLLNISYATNTFVGTYLTARHRIGNGDPFSSFHTDVRWRGV